MWPKKEMNFLPCHSKGEDCHDFISEVHMHTHRVLYRTGIWYLFV